MFIEWMSKHYNIWDITRIILLIFHFHIWQPRSFTNGKTEGVHPLGRFSSTILWNQKLYFWIFLKNILFEIFWNQWKWIFKIILNNKSKMVQINLLVWRVFPNVYLCNLRQNVYQSILSTLVFNLLANIDMSYKVGI